MSSAFTTAPPPSNSAPASMETLLAMMGRVVAKFEARLEAQERRRATAFPPSRSEFDLPFGRPRTSWDLPEPPQQPAFGVQQPPSSTGWHLQGAPSSWAQPSAAGADVTSRPLSSWDLPPAGPVSSWDLPQSRPQYDPHAQRFPSSSSPDPDAYDPNLCSNPSYWNYADPYAYDPPVGRPLTSWDLPRPRIESYGGGGSSPYMYGASSTHGDGGYALSSYHGGGYSGGGYANERNSYAPPPPPQRDGFYVPVPQPCVFDPPPSRTELVPRPVDPEIEEKERGRVSFSIDSELVEEAGNSKVLDSARTQNPNPVKATYGSGIGEGDLNNAVESSTVVNNDDELCNKFPVDGSFLVIGDVVRDVEGEQLGRGTKITLFFKEDQSMESIGERRIKDLVREYSEFINYPIGHWMEKIVEKEISDAINDELKKDKEEECEVEREILEVLRRLVIFRIYALEEVYKDFLYLHLEDKVILKGGGVDTSRFNYFN